MKDKIKILLSLLDNIDYYDPYEDIYDIRKQLVRINEDNTSLIFSYLNELREELVKQRLYGFGVSKLEALDLEDVILYIDKLKRIIKIKLIKNIK